MTNSKDNCQICGGNDADMPCAYPETDDKRCWKNQRSPTFYTPQELIDYLNEDNSPEAIREVMNE